MKQIVFITNAKFWFGGAGFWARSREMVKFLSRQGQLTVVCLGTVQQTDLNAMRKLGVHMRIKALGQPPKGRSRQDYWQAQFRKISDQLPQADVYLIDRTENSFMLDMLPHSKWQGQSRPKFIVDMHDLVSARTAKHQQYNLKERHPMTADEERQVLGRYDAVICIQQNELHQVAQWIDGAKSMLVPHPLKPRPQTIREQAKNIGLVASHWHANVNGLRRFLQYVWPRIRGQGVNLYVFGPIAELLKQNADPQIYPKGFRAKLQECYEHLDIVINPVFYGAGLKIKSVEALSFGLPLVTTEEGASGLEHLDGSALLIARSNEEYAQYLVDLIDDQTRRQQLSDAAIKYVTEYFNEESCFAPLQQFLEA